MAIVLDKDGHITDNSASPELQEQIDLYNKMVDNPPSEDLVASEEEILSDDEEVDEEDDIEEDDIEFSDDDLDDGSDDEEDFSSDEEDISDVDGDFSDVDESQEPSQTVSSVSSEELDSLNNMFE